MGPELLRPEEPPAAPSTSQSPEGADSTFIPRTPDSARTPGSRTPDSSAVDSRAPDSTRAVALTTSAPPSSALYVAGLVCGIAFGVVATFFGIWNALEIAIYGALGVGAAHILRLRVEGRLHIRRAIFALFRGE